MTQVVEPIVNSRWLNSAWNNPDYEGAWRVIRDSEYEVVLLHERTGAKHETPKFLWPASWVPLEAKE